MITIWGPGEIAQWVKYLPCKHENLSWVPQHSWKEQGVLICACNPSDGEGQTGVSKACLAKSGELQVQRENMSHKQRGEWLRKTPNAEFCPPMNPSIHIQICIHIVHMPHTHEKKKKRSSSWRVRKRLQNETTERPSAWAVIIGQGPLATSLWLFLLSLMHLHRTANQEDATIWIHAED